MQIDWAFWGVLAAENAVIVSIAVALTLWLVYHFTVRRCFATLYYTKSPFHDRILAQCETIHKRYDGAPLVRFSSPSFSSFYLPPFTRLTPPNPPEHMTNQFESSCPPVTSLPSSPRSLGIIPTHTVANKSKLTMMLCSTWIGLNLLMHKAMPLFWSFYLVLRAILAADIWFTWLKASTSVAGVPLSLFTLAPTSAKWPRQDSSAHT